MKLHEIFHSAKEAINRTRKEPVKWEYLQTQLIGLISNTRKDPKQANSKKNQPNEKMGKGLHQYFLDLPSRPEALTTNNKK